MIFEILLILLIQVSIIDGYHVKSSVYNRLNRNGYSSLQMNSCSDEVNSLISEIKAKIPVKSRVVVKYGGHAMENEEMAASFCSDIAILYSL